MSIKNINVNTLFNLLLVVCITLFGYFTYDGFIADRYTEVDSTDYVYAAEYYATCPGTKELFCKSIEDKFLSKHEDRILLHTLTLYQREQRNKESKAVADSIKTAGCVK